MNSAQKKVAEIIIQRDLSVDAAKDINSRGEWLEDQADYIKLPPNQFNETYKWAERQIQKNHRFDYFKYLAGLILSLFMVPFAFSDRDYLAPWGMTLAIGSFGLKVLLVVSSAYFLIRLVEKINRGKI